MKLESSYKKYGDMFRYITHEGDWYIYMRAPYVNDDGDVLVDVKPHYEVVKPVFRKAQSHETAEWVYPSPTDWGLYGFTVGTLERAKEKLKELSNG